MEVALFLMGGYVFCLLWLLHNREAEVFMYLSISIMILGLLVFCASPAKASLPYYNSDIGYTIWLPKSWAEASLLYLKGARQSYKPVPVQGDMSNWKAGYFSPTEAHSRSLLVEVKRGRRMHAADISNFNQFIVKSLSRMSRAEIIKFGFNRITLKNATYFKEKKVLRIETEMDNGKKVFLSLTYIVYTRTGMLTFVGYMDPIDIQAKLTIDKAVLSLYLDDDVRY